jgi:arylsulfatase A-like enzyme
MNVVVIISDTMRKDFLGCYGNKEVHTPHLSRFAEKSLVFDRAYAASFPTMPMRADLFTGKFTFTYLGWAPLPREEIILPQVLAQAGFTTMAVVDTPFFIRGQFGYDRGFQDFRWIRGQGRGSDRQDTNHERRYEEDYCAPMTCAAAERWLELHYQEKFFLYVDTWDPHEPWDPPAYYVRLYYPEWDGQMIRPTYWRWKERGLTAKDIKIARACYAGEVTMVDRAVGRLIERIESLGIMDETIILFTSDHGFHLGEHGLLGKILSKKSQFVDAPLYEEVTHIPLIIYVPGAKRGRTNALVTAPDFMPTILELLGQKIPATVEGESFAAVIKGKKAEHRRFVVTTMPLYNPGQFTRAVDNFERRVVGYLPATITSGPWTLLYAKEGAPVELYNLKTDPAQKKNVAKKYPNVVKRLHRMFYGLIENSGTSEELLAPRRRL